MTIFISPTQTERLPQIAAECGFQQAGISGIDLATAGEKLTRWLKLNYHGGMDYMSKHGDKRYHPEKLIPETLSVITARLDYLPESIDSIWQALKNPKRAMISRYALGRDYHKVMRKKLNLLASKLCSEWGEFRFRVFTDSAPVMEKPLAAQAGLGWIGKNTNLINRHDGSFFFLGVIYTNLSLTPTTPVKNHCGSCQKCLTICPTQAIVAPYQLDARRCISYLTIEHHGSIPEELRPLIGNRIYGCDDCQAICPWNRYAQKTDISDFTIRHGLDTLNLINALQWTENDFLRYTEGSAIRRIGYRRWIRNVAVAMGNAPFDAEIFHALQTAKTFHTDEMCLEHIQWAIEQQKSKSGGVV